MKPIRYFRFFIAIGLLFLLLGFLLLGITLTDSLLSLIERLDHFPTWLNVFLGGLFLGFSVLAGWLVYWVIRRDKKIPVKAVKAPSADDIFLRLLEAESQGIDVTEAKQELNYLDNRKLTGEIYIAIFGDISSGKSSLIKALIPEVRVQVNVRGGTTQSIDHFEWSSAVGDKLVLVDMPGLAETQGTMDEQARAEALRSHLVIYVCDGDLTRQQLDELKTLFVLNKPVIVAFNKVDRLASDERQLVIECIEEKTVHLGGSTVVSICSGGQREVIRVMPDGEEIREMKQISAEVDELLVAIQAALDQQQEVLDQLRESSVFVLVQQHLDEAIVIDRKSKSEALVENYTRRAVMGAMAAMAPGTDLVIQGYLASRLVTELAEIHQVEVKEMDVNELMGLVQKHVAKTNTLMLAIAGNALKAFPGIGTLAGGALHAIAYGILFDSFGRAVSASLASRGALHPLQTAQQFKESLGENLERSARSLAKMVIHASKDKN